MAFDFIPARGLTYARTTLLLLWLLRSVHRSTGLEIDTPNNLTECETAKLTWSSSQPPYLLNILHQNNSLVEEFDNIDDTFLFWKVNVAAGTRLYLEILDSGVSTGPAYSNPFTVQSGNDTTCLQSLADISSTSTALSTSLEYTTTGPGAASLGSSTLLASFTGFSSDSGETSTRELTAGSIASSIAMAALLAILSIILGVWLARKRRRPSNIQEVTNQQHRQLDLYHDPGRPCIEDLENRDIVISEVPTQANSSMAAQDSSMSSDLLNGPGYSNCFHGEDIRQDALNQKLLRELSRRNRSDSTLGRRNEIQEIDLHSTTRGIVSLEEESVYPDHPTIPRRDTDGGVRLAGGRPGEEVADDHESPSSTLPPAYSSDLGDD